MIAHIEHPIFQRNYSQWAEVTACVPRKLGFWQIFLELIVSPANDYLYSKPQNRKCPLRLRSYSQSTQVANTIQLLIDIIVQFWANVENFRYIRISK